MPDMHKNTAYKPIEVPNPFGTADKAYADILKDKMREAKWWRLTGAGALILFAVSLLILNSAVRRQQTVPVLVNVMPSGEAQYLGEVRQAQAQVPEAAIVFQVRTFITFLRSVPTDPQVLYNNIDACYSMATGGYEPVMTRMLRAASPFDLVGRVRRSAEIESVIRVTAGTYQVDWLDVALEGSSRRGTRMRALVTVKLLPTTDETIKKNPLGIYIDNCEMTEL